MAPALLFFVAQPIGNLVDRPTTSRPQVMGAMAAVAAVALAVAAASPPTAGCSSSRAQSPGSGCSPSQPAQVALLADRYPLAARAPRSSAATPRSDCSRSSSARCSRASARRCATRPTDEWRVGFLAAAVLVAVARVPRALASATFAGAATKSDAVFGDDRDLVAEQPSFAHVVARFAQIQTLRLMTVGVVVLGLRAARLGPVVQPVPRPALRRSRRRTAGCCSPLIAPPGVLGGLRGRASCRPLGSARTRHGRRATREPSCSRLCSVVGGRFVDAERRAPRGLRGDRLRRRVRPLATLQPVVRR